MENSSLYDNKQIHGQVKESQQFVENRSTVRPLVDIIGKSCSYWSLDKLLHIYYKSKESSNCSELQQQFLRDIENQIVNKTSCIAANKHLINNIIIAKLHSLIVQQMQLLWIYNHLDKGQSSSVRKVVLENVRKFLPALALAINKGLSQWLIIKTTAQEIKILDISDKKYDQGLDVSFYKGKVNHELFVQQDDTMEFRREEKADEISIKTVINNQHTELSIQKNTIILPDSVSAFSIQLTFNAKVSDHWDRTRDDYVSEMTTDRTMEILVPLEIFTCDDTKLIEHIRYIKIDVKHLPSVHDYGTISSVYQQHRLKCSKNLESTAIESDESWHNFEKDALTFNSADFNPYHFFILCAAAHSCLPGNKRLACIHNLELPSVLDDLPESLLKFLIKTRISDCIVWKKWWKNCKSIFCLNNCDRLYSIMLDT